MWSSNKSAIYGFLFTAIFVIALTLSQTQYHFARGESLASKPAEMPSVKDPDLTVELVSKGLKFPTSMAFLGPDDILVLEKNNGTVRRIVNGDMVKEPLLDVNVATKSERGMLGIAVAKNGTSNTTYVFLYYTETAERDGSDVTDGKRPLGNRLYRYELENDKLVSPKILLDLPATPGPIHNGGKIALGPDNNIYLVIGNVNPPDIKKTQTENFKSGLSPDGRGGILRITQDGKVVPGRGILGDNIPLNLYYAYGIRNSFGMDFDPVTGNLWDTENGPNYGDEINLVQPGFNSGWSKVQGIWEPDQGNAGKIILNPIDLTDFGMKGNYKAPKFMWYNSTGPTGIAFLNSDKLGVKYVNDMFVGDFHKGNLYHFDLDGSRQELVVHGPLADRIVNNQSELQGVIFGYGFGGITDLAVGPDGYLYILSLYQSPVGTNCDIPIGDPNRPCIQYSSQTEGTIFRVVPK